MIERYSDKYIDDIARLVESFHKEAVHEYDDILDKNALIETIKTHKHKGFDVFLLVLDGKCEGILVGSKVKSLVSDRVIFQEVMWYVNPDKRVHGVGLLRRAEKLLKDEGVSIIIMAVLENSKADKLKQFYARLGYKPMETHFVRTL